MVSETGALEVFLFGSAFKTKKGYMNRNQRISHDLASVTGFAPLPPRHTLGFHFSKYDVASAEIIMERNRNFTDYEFPVDVLVMDIQWADKDSAVDGYEYFQFNPQNFTMTDLAQMNSEVEAEGRYMTTILDPHIKVADDYFVYADGQDLQDESKENSIFVKQVDG
jgi:alpha-glucosidase (family GH31 glycosyl hydrolase)|mmetsp:Transcript_6459/g.8668  ORF Transcript_6459/g.8668 Transcript_6459/m.8668 type:complete len:166 (+) Transcript_6459:1089-1586(+)